MRRADFASDADYYRAHRKVFELAQELGCTPIEAERRMKDEEARMRHLVLQARLDAKRNAPLIPGLHELQHSVRPTAPLHEARHPAWGSRWMMQE